MAEFINVKVHSNLKYTFQMQSLIFRFNLMLISCRQKHIAKLINSKNIAVYVTSNNFLFSLNIRHIEKYLK
jgi:hypothetical protein